MRFVLPLLLALTSTSLAVPPAEAQSSGPLRIEINQGVVEPLPFAIPNFVAENPGAADWAAQLTRVVASDLAGTGLFREISQSAFISGVSDFNAEIRYPDWRAINAEALITGAVSANGNQITLKFRLFDVFSGAPLGDGLQFSGTADSWRRMGHKVADQVYSRITGEGGYFDSRVVFVSETGPKADRKRQLAVMDYDGANVQYLTDAASIVLAPRFSPTGDRVLYTSYETGFPQIVELVVGAPGRRSLGVEGNAMTFAPRYAPDGRTVVYSLSQGGNTDIYALDTASGRRTRLTNAPSIETSPSFSPDGSQIVFESDRSGTQQLYVMPVSGGEPRRISFGAGRYGTPVWSPRGDLIAFTKQNQGRFHIGVMRTDGSGELLLTASFLDEGPTWSPNGRVIMFTRETPGEAGKRQLFSVDISGRNLRKVPTPAEASDAAWSPLLP